MRFLYDYLGSKHWDKTKLEALVLLGAKVSKDVVSISHLNYRDHRKIVVIDGEIGYTGGYNVVAIPAGWTVDPQSYGGGAIIHGPHNELAVLDNAVSALDPNGSGYRNTMQYNHGRPLPGQIIYPSNVDLVKALPEIVNLIRRSKGPVQSK